jgi:hypothetical protein
MKKLLRKVAMVLDVAGVIALLAGTGALLWYAAFSRSVEGEINYFLGLRFFEGSIRVGDALNGNSLPPEWHGYTLYWMNNRVLAVGTGLSLLIASSALRRLASWPSAEP